MQRARVSALRPFAPRLHAGSRCVIFLVAAGLLYVSALVLGLLYPLALWRYPRFIETRKEQITVVLGDDVTGAAYFAATFILLILAYLIALGAVDRHTSQVGIHRRVCRLLAFLFPVVFVGVLLGTAPLGSKDIYHYVAEGRIWVHYGANPLTTAPAAYPDDPLMMAAYPWQEVASRYGPAWALLTYLPARLAGDSFVANILAFKALIAFCYLAILPLLYLLAERFRAGSGTYAIVFFAWNPLVVYDGLINAHNDLAMLALTCGALLCALQGRWRLALPLLTLSVLVKFVTVLLFPLSLVWALRGQRAGVRRAVLEGGGISALLVMLLYIPFWQGGQTFEAVRRGSDWVINSPTALLVDTLDLVLPRSLVVKAAQIVLTTLFVAAYGRTLLVTKPSAGPDRLVRSGFVAFFFYVVLMAWWFWPWYMLWPLTFAAPLKGTRDAVLAIICSVSALAGHLVYDWRELLGIQFGELELSLLMSLAVFLAPSLYWVRSQGLVLPWRRGRFRPGGHTRPGRMRRSSRRRASVSKASITIPAPIFEPPPARSPKTMGTSLIRKPYR